MVVEKDNHNMEKMKLLSIIEEKGQMVYLAIVGSRAVNGMARLHSEFLK